MVDVDGVYLIRDDQIQAECLRILHHDQYPVMPTRAELARLLRDEQITEDAAQRAIRDLESVGALDVLQDDLVRLPLAVATALRLAEVQ